MADPLRCSFCGSSQHDVAALIAGPPGHFICDLCVEVCVNVVKQQQDRTTDKYAGQAIAAAMMLEAVNG